MKRIRTYWYLILTMTVLSVLAASCATFEVGIETNALPISGEGNESIEEDHASTEESPLLEVSSTPVLVSSPSPTSTPTEILGSTFPDMVTIGHLTPYGGSDIGVLVLENGMLSVQPSPVYHQVYWDYSPQTGRIAYSPEFVHGSETNNVSVTSLWVADYETGASEEWLADNVIRAAWTADGERITAARYNPASQQIELVLVNGPNEVNVISECASNLFAWDPDGIRLAYVNAVSWAGVKDSCAGTYLVSFPNGILAPEREIQRVSDFGTQPLMSGDYNDKPIWAVDQNALIYPDQPFWIIPLDGSPAFIPATPGGENHLDLPRPFSSLWAADLHQLVGNYEAGMSDQGGVWVYQLSSDLSSIESYNRIGNDPLGGNSFVTLFDWWVPGESILVLDGDNPDASQYLSEFWPAPVIWSLTEKDWLEYPNR